MLSCSSRDVLMHVLHAELWKEITSWSPTMHFFSFIFMCIAWSYLVQQVRVFSLNFWWGDLKIFGPRRSPMGRKSDGGDLQKKSDWSHNCPLNAKLGNFLPILSMKYSFLRYFLKVVKFDTKMYLNFSNFWGRTSAGGDKPWSKNGDKVSDGGIGKIFARWGDPQSPPGKKPCKSFSEKQ